MTHFISIVLRFALIVLALLAIDVSVGWWHRRRRAMPVSDPVIGQDQWTDQRRAHLADLQRPAAKFIETRHHTRRTS